MLFDAGFPIEIQTRDEEILTSLFACRVMTLNHVAAIHFDGRKEAAKKRIQKLKAAKLVAERERRINDPSILFLTRKGLVALEDRGILSKYPRQSMSSFERRIRVSQRMLQHELEVMDVKAAFHSAVRRLERFSVAQFNTWPLLHQFEAALPGSGGVPSLIKPDGYTQIQRDADAIERFPQSFFLELDRSTEEQEILESKAQGYLDYYKSGGFAARHGAAPDQYKSFPFRVLVVLKTTERRNETAERLIRSNPPILSLCWLSTLREVIADPFGAVWIRPVDYRSAIKETRFDSGQAEIGPMYRRRSEREFFVECCVKKCRLLE